MGPEKFAAQDEETGKVVKGGFPQNCYVAFLTCYHYRH